MVIDLAAGLSEQSGRTIIVRDMAVSDGVTALDLAEEAGRRGVDVSITATDLRLHLLYAEHDGNEVVCCSDGEPCQYLIDGQTYGMRHPDVPAAMGPVRATLDKSVQGSGAERITMLAPQVDSALQTGKLPIRFEEEDAFDPNPDVGHADIIRVANLFVERDDDHRGYYYRQDILKAISRLGEAAKDGAYLYLDNFRRKVEHIGLWQKNGSAGEWRRLAVGEEFAADLDGVTSIPTECGASR
jgi:hypothetical protein